MGYYTFYCIPGNIRAYILQEYQPTKFILIILIFSAMSNEIRFLYQNSQFLGIKLSARSHVLVQEFSRMLTEIEVKCMDVYQNENACSKYLMLSTNAVSRYVSVFKIAFGCVHNMSFLNFAQAMYVILFPPWKTMLNQKYVIYLNKDKVLLSKNASKQLINISVCTNLSATNLFVCCQSLYEYFKSSHFELP